MTAAPRVLIVDDSATAALAIRVVLERHGIRVVGVAADGARALHMVRALRPDLVTMDVNLPGGDGIGVTARIMAEAPTPVLVITSLDCRDSRLVYRAMQAGAVDLVGKPPAPDSGEYAEAGRRLAKLVKALAQVPVVRRPARTHVSPLPTAVEKQWQPDKPCSLVAIGASTGGPVVVRQVLRALPSPFPVPIALVQHILPGFVDGFAGWLESETRHAVRVVNEVTTMLPGTVYVAQDGRHLQLIDTARLAAADDAPVENQRPSVDRLFESAAAYVGGQTTAVLMTGMGRDGAHGMRALHAAGALTIAQDPESCAVPAMPNSAIAMGAARLVRTPEGVAAELCRLFGLSTT